MGAWAYCHYCSNGLDKPTAREAIEGTQRCASGHINQATQTKDEFLIDLAERVEQLEAMVVKGD